MFQKREAETPKLKIYPKNLIKKHLVKEEENQRKTCRRYSKNTQKKRKKIKDNINNVTINKKNVANDNIIIHLPIKTDKVTNNMKEAELLTYNPNLREPTPF